MRSLERHQNTKHKLRPDFRLYMLTKTTVTLRLFLEFMYG